MYDSYSCTKFLLSLLLYVGELDRWLVAVFYFFFFFISFLAVSIQILKFCLWSNCFLTWIHTLIIVAQNILYYLTNANSLMIMTTKLISMKSSSYFFFLEKVVILLAYGLITWKVETKSFSKWANNYFYYSLTLLFFSHFGIKRMEKVALRSTSSQAKILGTIISISGAFVVTLYKGPPIVIAQTSSVSLNQPLNSVKSNWVIGGLLLTAEYILVPLWYIVQVNSFLPLPKTQFQKYFQCLALDEKW